VSAFIEVVDDALDAALCDELVARFHASPHVGPGHTGHGVDPARKDSRDVTITEHAEWDDLTRRLLEASLVHLVAYARRHPALVTGALAPALVDATTGVPAPLDLARAAALDDATLRAVFLRLYRFGRVNVQHYQRDKGGYHHWHSEIMPLPDGGEALHRVLFFQVYLNDVAQGGETEFLEQRLKVAARKGRLLIAPAGFTHTHKGHVPRSDDKLIATSWVLFQRAEQLY
jgi:hypothetical protein